MAINVNEKGRPWSNSEGGPVLAVPAELAAAWRGTLPPIGVDVPAGWKWGAAGGPKCDYDRACDPPQRVTTGYGGFGAVAVGDGVALALDAEIVTEWLADGDGGVIARSSSDESEAETNPAKVEAWEPFPGAARITLRDGRLFLFDSAAEGQADPENIRTSSGVGVVTLTPGTYELEVGSDDDEIDYVRFRKI